MPIFAFDSNSSMYHYTVIVPVYNRPQEVLELLESLSKQRYTDFDVLLIEDGSTKPCLQEVARFKDRLNIKYHFKENSGPGDSRNVGMSMAKGDYLVFFDSDCIIPKDYFSIVDNYLQDHPLDCYGGPDAAHDSFSAVQKAINHVMTSFITTGGIRGKEKQVDRFQPRSFNMGFRKKVYETIGGFSDIHPGEDPDLSYRMMRAGFTTGLISDAYVYHKRRIDFGKFAKQVYKFGIVRNILSKWYPQYRSPIYFFPSLFLLGSILLILLAVVFLSLIPLIPLIFFSLFILIEAMIKTGNFWIALLSVRAAFTQLFSYGLGFLRAYWLIHILKKDERQSLQSFFFRKKNSL